MVTGESIRLEQLLRSHHFDTAKLLLSIVVVRVRPGSTKVRWDILLWQHGQQFALGLFHRMNFARQSGWQKRMHETINIPNGASHRTHVYTVDSVNIAVCTDSKQAFEECEGYISDPNAPRVCHQRECEDLKGR